MTRRIEKIKVSKDIRDVYLKLNECIDAINEMSEGCEHKWQRMGETGFYKECTKCGTITGHEDKQDIICPTCHYSDMEMTGDPEYNDEWHCENCGHDGGSSFGKPEGSNLDDTLEDKQEDEEESKLRRVCGNCGSYDVGELYPVCDKCGPTETGMDKQEDEEEVKMEELIEKTYPHLREIVFHSDGRVVAKTGGNAPNPKKLYAGRHGAGSISERAKIALIKLLEDN